MIISEMIAQLEELKEKHGDLPCMQWRFLLQEYKEIRADLIYFDRECGNCNTPKDAIYFDVG